MWQRDAATWHDHNRLAVLRVRTTPSRGQTHDDSALVDDPDAGDVACVGAAVHSLSQDR